MPEDASPYYYYDLDWIVTVPNMDPWIRSFETLQETTQEVVVKTGFNAVMRKVFHCRAYTVSSAVSGHTYDYIVKLVREYGRYPLNLGEFDEAV
jgi:hypothetical protein